LDIELEIIKQRCTKPATVKYYTSRHEFLKNFVRTFNLTFETFDEITAYDFITYRLGSVQNKGAKDEKKKVGFNNRPCRPATVNKEITLYREYWRIWRETNKTTAANPWTRIRPVKDPDKIEPKRYSLEEVKKIFDNIKIERVRNLLIFQAMLGTRPGIETLSIDAGMMQRSEIKNWKKDRIDRFDYSPAAIAFFYEHIEGKMDGLSVYYVNKQFKKACKAAGVRIGKPYDLRKTFGTQARKAFDLETVQALMRHKEIKTTQIYAVVEDDETAKARAAMQKTIFEAVKEEPPKYNAA
jgi:integrase